MINATQNTSKIDAILDNLSSQKCWKSFMKTHCRRNKLDCSLASAFSILRARGFYLKLSETQLQEKVRYKSSVWRENQLKLFQWLAVALSGITSKLIETFGNQELSILGEIFDKQRAVVQYQALKMIDSKTGRRKWGMQQNQMLKEIVKENPNQNRWNEVARSLFEQSQRKYFRSGKQCRQQWLNHLNPDKKRGSWDLSEDQIIVSYILKYGKKWAQISKQLNGRRTEHCIKNRFKSISIALRKKCPKIQSQNELLRQLLESTMEAIQQQRQQEQVHSFIPAVPILATVPKIPTPTKGMQGKFKITNLKLQESDDQNISENMDNFEHKQKVRTSRQIEIFQVVTPSPVIFQTFTPNFLNTPNAMPFFMGFGFDSKHQNRFIDND